MSSVFILFSCVTFSSSLMVKAPSWFRSSKPGVLAHILSKVEQFQIAWIVVSDSTPHCAHVSSFRIFLRDRLCFVGMASLQARHVKFLTLFGTLSPHISFQTSFCCYKLPASNHNKFSLAKNLEPEFTV